MPQLVHILNEKHTHTHTPNNVIYMERFIETIAAESALVSTKIEFHSIHIGE